MPISNIMFPAIDGTDPLDKGEPKYVRLPTSVAALHSIIDALQAELKAITQLTTPVARPQAELATPTPTTTTITITTTTTPTTPTPISATTLSTATATEAPIPCSHPEHPRTIASGRGAASPEVFQQMIKIHWHGRLGRTHMVDVDGLPAAALTELDCLLRRRLRVIFPRGGAYSAPDPEKIFASLAALGLRLEDRGAYADLLSVRDLGLHDAPTVDRGKNYALWYYGHDRSFVNYWLGSVLETLIELARYRGLFDREGFLKKE